MQRELEMKRRKRKQKMCKEPASQEEGIRGVLSIVVATEAWRGAGVFIRMINWESSLEQFSCLNAPSIFCHTHHFPPTSVGKEWMVVASRLENINQSGKKTAGFH